MGIVLFIINTHRISRCSIIIQLIPALTKGDLEFNEHFWDCYKLANQQFCNVVSELLTNNDTVWIHDYHLMLLPEMLRSSIKQEINVKIGFFLHTPFPSSEVT